jgi:hypothetical protein
MLKLKKIISQLSVEEAASIQSELQINKAQNFLFLLNAYRDDELSDQQIMKELGSNSNAFYVLKSRLHEKIQQHLTGNKAVNKVEILQQLANINQYCFEVPRETAVSILLKLEKDLKAYDLAADLTVIYSTLKKLHLNSSKYYHYSQLYNKHVAYAMVLEKAEDLLGNFANALSAYYFSRSQYQKDIILMLKKEIDNIYALNNAHRIEFIKNLITIQTFLFVDVEFDEEQPVEDLLNNCDKIIEKFPSDNYYKLYSKVVSFLWFEYYKKIGQMKKAVPYFDAMNDDLPRWLLYGNCCQAYRFLISKLEIYSRTGLTAQLYKENSDIDFIYDHEHTHTDIILKLFLAVSAFYGGKRKESIALINDALNNLNTKEGIHIEMELKCCLAYFYYVQGEQEMCANLLRSMYRKINALEKPDDYENVLDFSRVLNLLMNSNESADSAKVKKALKMFEFNNNNERNILSYLSHEIDKLKNGA